MTARSALMLALLLATPAAQGAAAVEPSLGAAEAEPTLRWSDGEARPFLAGAAEVGSIAHLRGVAGWGQPHWLWGGLLVDGWVNRDMATGTAGARLALLLVNLDLHWRVTRNFDRLRMAPASRHDEVASGGASTLHAWDLDLWGVAPTPGGLLTWEAQATRLLGLPRDVDVFDEGVHAIVRPPWSGFASLGWLADLRGGDLQVGGSVDAAALGRGAGLRWRIGPSASWSLTPRWTLRGQVLVTVAGPDRLPLGAGLGGGVTIGYRTATGLDRPAPSPAGR
jgi:hypothetical protein